MTDINKAVAIARQAADLTADEARIGGAEDPKVWVEAFIDSLSDHGHCVISYEHLDAESGR